MLKHKIEQMFPTFEQEIAQQCPNVVKESLSCRELFPEELVFLTLFGFSCYGATLAARVGK